MKRSTSLQWLIIFCIYGWIPQIYGQSLGKEKILNQIRSFYTQLPQEKVFVHTDKPFYALGETIWFKAYLLDGGTHEAFTLSTLIRIDLLGPSGDVLDSKVLETRGAGAAGDFEIDPDGPSGTYRIQAYSQYMRNFDEAFIFQKDIKVYATKGIPDSKETDPIASKDYEVLFFPEGGDLIAGLSSRVGVKALDENGNGVLLEGKIFDQDGNFVTLFKTLKFGLGFFSLTPDPTKTYQVEVSYQGAKKTYPIPSALPQGYTLKTQPLKSNNIRVTLLTNIPNGLNQAILHGHIRGITFLTMDISASDSKFVVEIPANELPEGVVHFTLFDPGGIPVCERLTFATNPTQRVDLKILPDKKFYNIRDLVSLDLELSASSDTFDLTGELSASVVDEFIVPTSPHALDIQSYLLLTSDIKGTIKDPSYFFDPSQKGNKRLLDILLMTHGWRRFEWKPILEDRFPEKAFRPEQGVTLSGIITKEGNRKKPIPAEVFLTLMGTDFSMQDLKTGPDGYFEFNNLILRDTTNVILQAGVFKENKKKKKKQDLPMAGPQGDRYVSIYMDEEIPPKLDTTFSYQYEGGGVKTIDAYLSLRKSIMQVDSNYRQISIDLDEVVVKGRKRVLDDPYTLTTKLYKRPDSRIVLDSLSIDVGIYRSIFDLIRGRVPGVDIIGTFPEQAAIIRGYSSIVLENQAQIVLDGVPVPNISASTLDINNIAFVDVIRGARAAIFGGLSSNGVIAIYTRSPEDVKPVPQPGLLKFEHPGYYRAKVFYAPNYDKKQPEHIKPDYRTTLFWEPNLSIEADGKASLQFFTSDRYSQYRVMVQGITTKGIPVVGTAQFLVDQ